MDLNTYFQTHSQSDLARALGITPGMVWQWKTRLRRIPAERVLQIERATGGKVTRHELRPDLYPIEPYALASAAPVAATAQADDEIPKREPPPVAEAARQEAA